MALRMTRSRQFEISKPNFFSGKGVCPLPEQFFGDARPCLPPFASPGSATDADEKDDATTTMTFSFKPT